jgi:alanyl-tRNA synthetase
MDATKFRQSFLGFFKARGHAIIGGASLMPEHDASVLFTTAGMHPLVPFLLGEPHPAGKRLASVQKCIRTDDIMEVGDDVHLTFFEMLGNWSLGDYWKEDAIRMSYEYLTGTLGLEHDRLHITCFGGDADAPKDTEAADVWRSLGIPESRIIFNPKEDNWWGPAGKTGPCGPDTEMFYDMKPLGPAGETAQSNPARFWEIWNDVFMQYDKQPNGSFPPLKQKNVDTGMGLERTLAVLEGVPSLYETELFRPLVEKIQSLGTRANPFAVRVIADHTRAATSILAEGIMPGKVDQPYIVRRLIRRAVRYGRELGIRGSFLVTLAEVLIGTLGEAYLELVNRRQDILAALDAEEGRFQRTLQHGERQFAKAVEAARTAGQAELSGDVVFRLYDTFGFPPELTQEMATRQDLTVDKRAFQAAFESHQEKSRQGRLPASAAVSPSDRRSRRNSTRQPICSTRRCGRCSGRTQSSAAAILRPNGCASISRIRTS